MKQIEGVFKMKKVKWEMLNEKEWYLNNGLCEMTYDDTTKVTGGGIYNYVSKFLSNKLIWTNATVVYKNIFKPSNEQLNGKVTS